MEFIKVEIVYALFSTNEYVLISCVWMDPACSAMDTERTTIEHLGKTRPHVDLWSRRKSITDRSWRSMSFPLPSSRWNWWGVREKVRLWTRT
jgi:hypothetical protein